MATTTGQRVGIWIIAIAMIVGVVAGFAAMILGPKNQQEDQKKALEEQKKQIVQYCAQMEKTQPDRKLAPLDGYASQPFKKEDVKTLGKEVLVAGDGAAIKKTSTVTANYFGWTSDGKIFDSSNKAGATTPIQFDLGKVIKGWSEGLDGTTVGSTVRLTVPANQAYGDEPNAQCSPVGPLQFIVQITASEDKS